jgi:dTDP-4-dehydrorhamnose reductase
VVVNAAAYTEVDRAEQERELAFQINARGAGEAAAAAKRAGARFIHVSTDYVFDGRGNRPWREDDPISPLNAYGQSKAEGEALVRAANPQHVILRTSWVISPFGRNFVKTMINAAKVRDVLQVVDDQRGCPTSALDLADAILKLAERWHGGDEAGLGETFHVAGSGETSWCGLAQLVMDECRKLGAPAAEVRPIATADWPTPAPRPAYSVLDCSKFQADIGCALPDWRASTAEVVAKLVATDQH